MNQYNKQYGELVNYLNEGLMDFDELDRAINKLKVSAQEHGVPLREIAGNTFELFGVEIQVKGLFKGVRGESRKKSKDDNQLELDFEAAKRKCKEKGAGWYWCNKQQKCKIKDSGGRGARGGINEKKN